jgi:hypothetical protein
VAERTKATVLKTVFGTGAVSCRHRFSPPFRHEGQAGIVLKGSWSARVPAPELPLVTALILAELASRLEVPPPK